MANAQWIRTRRIPVLLPNLPAAWKGRTALLVSDLHLGNVNGLAFSRRIATRAARLQPDVVFLPGDLFDGTEIDEILTLRILALSDAEKRDMAAVDARARALLERTHDLSPENFALLHGTMRPPEGPLPIPAFATPNEVAPRLAERRSSAVRLIRSGNWISTLKRAKAPRSGAKGSAVPAGLGEILGMATPR